MTSKAKAKTKRRPRKSTFVVRKEEKQRLEEEFAQLQAQWQALHSTAAESASPPSSSTLAPDPATASAPATTTPRAPLSTPAQAIARTLHGHHLAFNGLRSLLSAYFFSHHKTTAHDAIHLVSDASARRNELLARSGAVIRDARLELLERCRFLDLSRPHVASEWFECEDGDMFLLQLDITPFRGLCCSVRDVHDAVGFYVQNVEIYVSERLGDLTIREDDEVDATSDARISQRRVVSKTSTCGLTIDANVAVFRQHFAAGVCSDFPDEHSVLITHPVESDELYPYVPHERVRHDLRSTCLIQQVTSANGEQVATLVRSCVIKRHNRTGGGGDGDGDGSTTTSGCSTIAEDAQAPMRMLAAQWDELMLLAVKERLYAKAAALPGNLLADPPT